MTTSAYEEVPTAVVQAELAARADRPTDVGGDALPFDHISGRRFEILTYLLRKTEVPAGDTVTLVKSTGDRGRDVLIYRHNQLAEIIQCKNQREAMTRPELVRELMKLALHAFRDPTLLGSGKDAVAYSIWCTGGFTEPAGVLSDTWPEFWCENIVRGEFSEIKEQYSSLAPTEWDAIKTFLLHDFPAKITLTKVDAIDLSARIRAKPNVYNQFFSGFVVAPLPDVKQALADVLRDGNWRNVSNEDLRHVIDRIETFPESRRVYLGLGYAFGVSPQLLADLTPEERVSFIENCFGGMLNNIVLIQTCVARRVSAIEEEYAPKCQYKNKAFRMVLHQTLTFRTLGQVTRVGFPPFLSDKLQDEFREKELWALIDRLCRRVWPDFQAILSPDFKAPTSDPEIEAIRKGVARHVVHGYKDGEAFERELLEDFRRNLNLVQEIVLTLEDYFPRDMLVVADARSAFADDALLKKMIDNVVAIEKLRSKATEAPPPEDTD